MRKTFFFPLIVAIFLLFGALALSAGLPKFSLFFDLISLLFIVGVAFHLLLMSFSLPDMQNSFKQAFEDVEYNSVTARIGLAYFRTMQRIVLTLGVVAFLIKMIIVLSSDEISGNYIMAFAVSLVPFFYSMVIVSFVCLPFWGAIRKKIDEHDMK